MGEGLSMCSEHGNHNEQQRDIREYGTAHDGLHSASSVMWGAYLPVSARLHLSGVTPAGTVCPAVGTPSRCPGALQDPGQRRGGIGRVRAKCAGGEAGSEAMSQGRVASTYRA